MRHPHLKAPKRSEFMTKDDHDEATALVRLVNLSLKLGATQEEVLTAVKPSHWYAPTLALDLKAEFLNHPPR